MTKGVTVISSDDRDRWVAEHEDGGLPSQSWSYAWGLCAEGYQPKLAVVRAAGARMLLPFVERHWHGTTDITTILGISGTSIVPDSSGPLRLWHEFATARGWVTGYIRLAVSVDLDGSSIPGLLVTNNFAFLLDLQNGGHLQTFSRRIQRKIRSAEENGEVTLVDDRPVLVEALKRLYPATMRRSGADAEFCFSGETLERWAADPASVLLGARVGASVEAVYLFLLSGGHAESHILGCTEVGRELTAWLIWNAIPRLRDKGATVLNLTGGMHPGDGIYRFKQGFNGVLTPRRSVYQIYDRPRYDALCRQAGVSETTDWFPPYRIPSAGAIGRAAAVAATAARSGD